MNVVLDGHPPCHSVRRNDVERIAYVLQHVSIQDRNHPLVRSEPLGSLETCHLGLVRLETGPDVGEI